MLYFIDRIDFVGDAPECHFQDKGVRHSVRKGIAHIVRDENGQEFVAGPSCARRHTKDTNWGERVPDFTKGATILRTEAHPGGGGGGAGPQADGDEDINNVDDFAVAYLRLRFEKLQAMQFKGAAYKAFEPYYQNWKSTGKLTEDARRHIENTENKLSQSADKFHMARLQKCYAVAFMIQAALKKELDDFEQNFLSGVDAWVKEKYTLSVAQMDKLKEILSKLDDPLFAKIELAYF